MTVPGRKESQDRSHLHPDVVPLLSLPPRERILQHWPKIFIGYSRAQHVLARLSELRDAPKRHRPRNLLIYSVTGNGKSSLINEFISDNPRFENPEYDWAQIPVMQIQAPAKPDENRFWNNILTALPMVYRPTENVARKEALALHAMRGSNMKVLVIDEIHNILTGRLDQQRFFLTVLKNMSNELQIPIVAAGTIDALRAIMADSQLESRFDRMHLPEWRLDDEFLQLLASFELMIPLENRSGLVEEDMARRLHFMSGGIIGELSEILMRASLAAIEDGAEQITKRVLQQLDWLTPGERRRGG
jgi:hypothetical protein